MKKHIAVISIALSTFTLPSVLSAQASPDAQQKQIQREINRVNQQLDKQEKESRYINNLVTQAEKQLGTIAKKQYSTEQQIEEAETNLASINQDKSSMEARLEVQQQAIAQQFQAMYTAGEQSHLRLLLRQDNPSDISRTLRYFEYMNKYRTDRITELNETLNEVRALSEKIDAKQKDLRTLKSTLVQQKQELEKTLRIREANLQKVSIDIRNKRNRLKKLTREEANLQNKINEIKARAERKRLAQQKRTEQRAEQRRREAAERTRAARVQAQQKPAQATTNQKRTAPRAPVATNKPFNQLKGKLNWPVSGRVLHNFGSKRNERQRWRGVVIGAPGGTRVRAIAPGRVAFAGWMDGYGHLLILEHDQNHMSLYGYNRAVYKREGQTVKANEVIAAVGNSSGRNQNALYFEIRRKTRPQNPARWLR